MQAANLVLDTPRLRLRIPQSADAEPMMEIHQDPEVINSILLTAPLGGMQDYNSSDVAQLEFGEEPGGTVFVVFRQAGFEQKVTRR